MCKPAVNKDDLLTYLYWYTLILKKGIRGGICHSTYRWAKANNKYIKDYDKNNE